MSANKKKVIMADFSFYTISLHNTIMLSKNRKPESKMSPLDLRRFGRKLF